MTIRKYNLLSAIAAVLTFYSGFCSAATITVQTDRNPVVLQESFQLLFEAVGKVDGEPDFSPLEKDVRILSTSTSTSMSIVNANVTRTKLWRLTLLPLKAGNVTIPAISFGKDKSTQIILTVESGSTGSTAADSREIFIEVEVLPKLAYVQAEVVYTVKLYRSIATSNEALSAPELRQGSAIIEPLDADRSYDVFINNRRYAVFERSYGIYPQVSGALSLTPVRFQAQVSANSVFSLDPFGSNNKTLVRQSEPVQLEIMPVPAAYGSRHWLPATDVKLSEEWSKNPLKLSPNEPVTRTLTLSAQGLTASQLAEIQELLPADFKQYPDKPVLENQTATDGITAVRQQKNAVIPLRAGEYTLPEIAVPWWNTTTDTMENAVLPERQVKVVAAAPPVATETPGEPPTLPALATGVDAPASTLPAADTGLVETAASPPDISIWQWLTYILALAWSLSIVYILKNRKRPPPQSAEADSTNIHAARKALKQACRDNDPQRAKTALLQWARARPGARPPTSLGDLEKHSNERLAEEIRKLSRRLYSRSTNHWRGEPLWQAFLQENKSAATDTTSRGKLEPLFRL